MKTQLFIGLISGTSMDAVDCVLTDISDSVNVIDQLALPFPAALKSEIQTLCLNQNLDLRSLGNTDISLAHFFADAVHEILRRNSLQASAIRAIGCHGQTIWHEPPQGAMQQPFTMQICDPNTLVELTGITTICDFRRMDMAAGGQGAPLVPAFHKHVFLNKSKNLAVLNLGGIANITLISADGSIICGFDTGPANVLMDIWTERNTGKHYDDSGNWAATGQLDSTLLETFLDEPYFRLEPPKSTGRELFNSVWLNDKLSHMALEPAAENVQRTLLELTAVTVSQEVLNQFKDGVLILCGGGTWNVSLQNRLSELLPEFDVKTSQEFSIHPDFVEAAAFAWFASQTLAGQAIDFPPFTGARHRVISGGTYHASRNSD